MNSLNKLAIASSFLLVACACDPGEVRPYKHYLYRGDLKKAVQLEDPDPSNDIPLEEMDGMICQTEADFRLKELERADLKTRLKACEDGN